VAEQAVAVERIQIGRVVAAYGLQGWLKVYSDTDPIDQILTYSPWLLRRGGKERQVEVNKGKTSGRGLIVLLDGVEDRNQAESMIGYEVWIDRSRLPALDEGDYYWHQLEGLQVITRSGAVLGRIDHLMETGTNDVMVVRPGTGSIDDRERLIPFVQDEVVRDVNIETAVIVVAWEPDY
jgi:16S rRNA processing protein RimM